MNVSLWGFLRFFVGVNLVVVSVAYFATGWTVFGNVPFHQGIVHAILAVLGIRLAFRAGLETMRQRQTVENGGDRDDSEEYGYNDQWEQENL